MSAESSVVVEDSILTENRAVAFATIYKRITHTNHPILYHHLEKSDFKPEIFKEYTCLFFPNNNKKREKNESSTTNFGQLINGRRIVQLLPKSHLGQLGSME